MQSFDYILQGVNCYGYFSNTTHAVVVFNANKFPEQFLK